MKAEFERLENIEDDTAQLKLLLKEEKEKNKGLNATLTLVNIGLDNYISKDKIKEKIKVLNEKYNKYTGYKGLEFSRTGVINSQIKVLKELLEE